MDAAKEEIPAVSCGGGGVWVGGWVGGWVGERAVRACMCACGDGRPARLPAR